jgi:predicted DCC family thiol-disulfide oxidoreductase YuxK
MTPARDSERDRRPPYSYRTDAHVPAFPDDKPMIVFDGLCVLCSGFARFVAKRDPSGQFRFTAAQSKLGQALYRHYGFDPDQPETSLLIDGGRLYRKSKAFAKIMGRLSSPWRCAWLVLGLPRPIRDWVYDRIARSRYRVFGRRSACVNPDRSWRTRVVG